MLGCALLILSLSAALFLFLVKTFKKPVTKKSIQPQRREKSAKRDSPATTKFLSPEVKVSQTLNLLLQGTKLSLRKLKKLTSNEAILLLQRCCEIIFDKHRQEALPLSFLQTVANDLFDMIQGEEREEARRAVKPVMKGYYTRVNCITSEAQRVDDDESLKYISQLMVKIRVNKVPSAAPRTHAALVMQLTMDQELVNSRVLDATDCNSLDLIVSYLGHKTANTQTLSEQDKQVIIEFMKGSLSYFPRTEYSESILKVWDRNSFDPINLMLIWHVNVYDLAGIGQEEMKNEILSYCIQYITKGQMQEEISIQHLVDVLYNLQRALGEQFPALTVAPFLFETLNDKPSVMIHDSITKLLKGLMTNNDEEMESLIPLSLDWAASTTDSKVQTGLLTLQFYIRMLNYAISEEIVRKIIDVALTHLRNKACLEAIRLAACEVLSLIGVHFRYLAPKVASEMLDFLLLPEDSVVTCQVFCSVNELLASSSGCSLHKQVRVLKCCSKGSNYEFQMEMCMMLTRILETNSTLDLPHETTKSIIGLVGTISKSNVVWYSQAFRKLVKACRHYSIHDDSMFLLHEVVLPDLHSQFSGDCEQRPRLGHCISLFSSCILNQSTPFTKLPEVHAKLVKTITTTKEFISDRDLMKIFSAVLHLYNLHPQEYPWVIRIVPQILERANQVLLHNESIDSAKQYAMLCFAECPNDGRAGIFKLSYALAPTALPPPSEPLQAVLFGIAFPERAHILFEEMIHMEVDPNRLSRPGNNWIRERFLAGAMIIASQYIYKGKACSAESIAHQEPLTALNWLIDSLDSSRRYPSRLLHMAAVVLLSLKELIPETVWMEGTTREKRAQYQRWVDRLMFTSGRMQHTHFVDTVLITQH